MDVCPLWIFFVAQVDANATSRSHVQKISAECVCVCVWLIERDKLQQSLSTRPNVWVPERGQNEKLHLMTSYFRIYF
jgi:hypothetical protein